MIISLIALKLNIVVVIHFSLSFPYFEILSHSQLHVPNEKVKFKFQADPRHVTCASLIRFTQWAIYSQVSRGYKQNQWEASICLEMAGVQFPGASGQGSGIQQVSVQQGQVYYIYYGVSSTSTKLKQFYLSILSAVLKCPLGHILLCSKFLSDRIGSKVHT